MIFLFLVICCVSSGIADTSSNTHTGKGAPTRSSPSWSTFAKVLGKLVVSSLVSFGTARASHHQSVMNARCSGTAVHELSILKQLPSRPSHPWRISHAWSTSGRVREQVFCFLSRLGALGNCCSHVNIFGNIDAPPLDSYHTAHRVPILIRVLFGEFGFPAQEDKGRF